MLTIGIRMAYLYLPYELVIVLIITVKYVHWNEPIYFHSHLSLLYYLINHQEEGSS